MIVDALVVYPYVLLFALALVVVGRGGPFAAHRHTPRDRVATVVGCG